MGNKRRYITEEQLKQFRAITGNQNNHTKDGNKYVVRISDEVWDKIKNEISVEQAISMRKESSKSKQEENSLKSERDYLFNKANILEEVLRLRQATENLEIYDIKPSAGSMGKETISISLLSDVHIEEVVLPD